MITTNGTQAENNTGLQSSSLGVKASAAMFKVVYSSLYERKEEAVLRELAANALDAHRDAGKSDIPISITLPTDMNPYLTIKDQGNGMSLETVKRVFFVLFESTKNNSNDDVGGFGVGSKSPFAISESYTVSTICNGLRTEIIMVIDNGLPQPVLTSEEVPTDEPNGTTVVVPVSSNRMQEVLQHIAHNIFNYWDILPEINEVTLTSANKTPFFSTKHYTTNTNHTYGQFYKTFKKVLVGPFIYDIPTNLLNRLQNKFQTTAASAFDVFYKNVVNNYSVLINSAIGALELAPSRERIEDTEENYQVLKKEIDNIIKVGLKEFNAYVVKAIKIIHSHIKDLTLDKYGLSRRQQEAILDDLVTQVGSEDLLEKLLSNQAVKTNVNLPEYVKVLKVLEPVLDDSYDSSTTSLYNYIQGASYLGYKTITNDSLQLATLSETATSIRRNTPYSAQTTLKDLVGTQSPTFVLTDAYNLTNTQKAKLNSAFRIGSLSYTYNGVCTAIGTHNYLELKNAATEKAFKHLVKNYWQPDIEPVYLTYADLEPQLKAAKKASGPRAQQKPRNETVVAKHLYTYNPTTTLCASDITVQDLYIDNKFKDHLIVFVHEDYYGLQNYLRKFLQLNHNKPVLFILVSTREQATKRYEKFLENNVNAFQGHKITSLLISLLGSKDTLSLAKLIRLTNFTGTLLKDYIEPELAKLIKKYDLDAINVRNLPDLHSNSSNEVPTLVGEEEEAFHYILLDYSKFMEDICKLNPTVAKSAIKKFLDTTTLKD